VLAIGEHGDYPLNEKGQQMYPRRHFFEQITAVCRSPKSTLNSLSRFVYYHLGMFESHPTRQVMASSGRAVPVFIDKYLSYSWADADFMWRRARELGVPFMARLRRGSFVILPPHSHFIWRFPIR
jgi:hypothetical protein